MIIAFLASMLIIKPKFDYSIIPALAGFGTALVSGATYTMVRYLRNKETPATIVFFFSFVSLVMLSPFIVLDFRMPTPEQWIYLLLIGIFAAAGQFSLTYAYRYGKASEIAVYNYVNILFAALLGFLIWHEIPDFLSIIGGMIIIGISVIIFYYNLKQKTE